MLLLAWRVHDGVFLVFLSPPCTSYKATSSVSPQHSGLVVGRHTVATPPYVRMYLVYVYTCAILCELTLYPAAAGNHVSQLSVPVFSLATVNEDGTTNMNIVTYASPVGIKPEPLWMISLYKVWSAGYIAFIFNQIALPICRAALALGAHEMLSVVLNFGCVVRCERTIVRTCHVMSAAGALLSVRWAGSSHGFGRSPSDLVDHSTNGSV